LVELYTGLAFEGPTILRRMKAELAALLQRDGFATVQDAVGADHVVTKKAT
jgi:dihydroorotate dehydrogenase